MSNIHILQTKWFKKVGVVAVDYPESGYWQAYIGVSRGWQEEADVHNIAEWGSKLTWQEAQGFFPTIDITKYKTYSKHE